jgi:hypothetical protein
MITWYTVILTARKSLDSDIYVRTKNIVQTGDENLAIAKAMKLMKEELGHDLTFTSHYAFEVPFEFVRDQYFNMLAAKFEQQKQEIQQAEG